MKEPIVWFNHMGLGDGWWHILYMLKIGGSHVFYCQSKHHHDLQDLIGIHDIELRDITEHPTMSDVIHRDTPESEDGSLNAWIGGVRRPYNFHSLGCPRDLIGFLIGPWFGGLSERIGVENPFKSREDFLLDGWHYTRFTSDILPAPLIIDSQPMSGQVSKWSEDEFEQLRAIRKDTINTYRTFECKAPIRSIAVVSNHAPWIAGVATGPIWGCLNKSNIGKPIYLLLDQVFLDYGPGMNIKHFSTVADMAVALKEDGWIA